MGNHHQAAIGGTSRHQRQQLERLGTMGHSNADNLTRPGRLQRSPQRWRHRRGRPGLDQGSALLLIRLETVYGNSHLRQVNGRLLARKFPQKTEHMGLALALRSHKRVGQHPTAGVCFDALEVNEICRREQSLLQQRLTGGPLQEGFGVRGQRRQKHLADQIKQLAATSGLKLRKIRAGLHQFRSGSCLCEVDGDARFQKRHPQHQPFKRLDRR